MKLSVRDRLRLQWTAGVVIGGAAVLYAYVHLLISPLIVSRDQGNSDLALLQEKLDQAQSDLHDADITARELSRLQGKLDQATNRFMLRPILGSMAMSAQAILDPIAQRCNLQLEPCNERGRIEIPGQKKDAGLSFDRYAVEIVTRGSFRDVREFVVALERSNPYLCISDLEIVGMPEDPLQHKVTICMEWPVFGERKPSEKGVKAMPGGPRPPAKPEGKP